MSDLLGELEAFAQLVVDEIRGTGSFSNMLGDELNREALCLAEECGEFIGAYRRASGQARRSGTWLEAGFELADILIVANVMAIRLRPMFKTMGIDFDRIITEKMKVIKMRGFKDAT